jgi:hypothetical protein
MAETANDRTGLEAIAMVDCNRVPVKPGTVLEIVPVE